jgi:ParB/RepB/Spo0J family partition protein
MSELFTLNQILPNPYQPREREDPEFVEKIALSIAQQGLLQIPVGRRKNEHIELAFGHTRLAAYKWLADMQPQNSIPGDFSRMPVEVRDLTDLQMFEMVIRENIERKDLSPVEQGRAMLRYREEFGKTSAEIGVLFGLSESAVRNKMRLVDLPELVQKQLATGQITEGQARELLTVARVAGYERVVEVAGKIVAEPGLANRTMETAFEKVKGVVKMWERWRSGEARGGDDLWPLSWTWEGQRYAGWQDFQKFWKGLQYDDLKAQFEHASRYLIDQGKIFAPHNQYIENRPASRDDVQEAVNHLFSPPACTACSWYAKQESNHYCGAAACHARKCDAWSLAELERVSQETGIKIYDPHRDGEIFEVGSDDYARKDTFTKWYEARKSFLRLRLHKTGWFDNFTGCSLVQLISIGDESMALVSRIKGAKNAEAEKERIQKEEYQARQRRVGQSEAFIDQIAVPVFGNVFRPLKRGVLIILASMVFYGHEVSADDDAAHELARRLLRRQTNSETCVAGPVAVAKHLRGVAKSWGLDLPGDWLELAEKFENETVD